MNTFVLETAQEFEAVAYYTVRLDNGNRSEFSRFWDKRKQVSPTLVKDFDRIVAQLEVMGNTIATKDLFRFEGITRFKSMAYALPKRGSKDWNSGWRLYCMHVTDFCIVLFNGGVKTDRNPAHCPNVRSHFFDANALEVAIRKAIVAGKIILKDNRLVFNPKESFPYTPLP